MATRGDTPGRQAPARGERKRRVKRYDTTGSKTIEELDPNSSYAKAYALIPAGSRVLDLGCGSGELASYLAARGDRVWGVDINAAALAQASASCVQTCVADLELTDVASLFPGLRFDVVVFADVLEHVREPWNLLQSARAVLDVGGRVVASIPNFAHAAVRLAVVSGAMPYRGLGILDGTHVRFFTLGGVTSLFEESGFRLQVIERTTLPFEQPSGLVPDVRVLRVPGDIERHVREDPENETLQFVVRAVMLPGEWDMSALRDRLHDVEAHSAEQTIGLRNLQREYAAAVAAADERAARLQREYAAAVAAADERAAQLSALEGALQAADAGRRAELLAVTAEHDAARAQRAAARRALEGELEEARTALDEAIAQRDEARATRDEARAQMRSRDTALRHELEGAHREVAELRDVLTATRERVRILGEERALSEAASAEAERRMAALADEHDRRGEREAHAAAVIAAAEADRAQIERALAHARHELLTASAQRDERAAAARDAEEALARARVEAAAAQEALRAATSELELLRKRERYAAIAWIAREHDERGPQDDGEQFWPNELATR